MQKSKWREYSYTIWLGISFCIMVIIKLSGGMTEGKTEEDILVRSENVGENLYLPGEVQFEELDTSVSDGEPVEQEKDATQVSVEQEKDATKMPVEQEKDAIEVPVAENAGGNVNAGTQSGDKSYFDDALFIGDSRTVGLYEYGGLGNAEVFADSGMSIYKIFKDEFTLHSGEKVVLEEALSEYRYGKIYIMLGINELGYDFDRTVERFGKAIARIRELQPDAYIFIQANMHISKGKSGESDIFNNGNINRYNDAISKFADGKQIFYLDVNPMFDDEEGYLSMEYTSDQAHILGKYYVDWVDFILQNAIL